MLMSEILFFDQQFGITVLFDQLLNNFNLWFSQGSFPIMEHSDHVLFKSMFDPIEGGK